ncbi:hypothetical protein [Roseivivax sediminis]|uniref:hypothetical protein n=1 Tax=Roseivivax sediminis TaxID=936889 RepID=UPI00122C1A8D|nr:hypothetical protein [Roseivivax sediminis]
MNRAHIKGSELQALSKGIISSLAWSVLVSSAALLSVAYFLVSSDAYQIAILAGSSLIFTVVAWGVMMVLAYQMRPPFREVTAIGFSVLVIGSIFSAGYAYWFFHNHPTPSWCESQSLLDATTAAFRDLPRGHLGFLNEIFVYYRSIDALAWCANLPGEANSIQILALVAHAGLTFFGFMSLLGSFQMATMDARAAFHDAQGLGH